MRRFAQISLGWFTLCAVIFVEVDSTRAFKRFIKKVGESMAGAKAHEAAFSLHKSNFGILRDEFNKIHRSTIAEDQQYSKSQLEKFRESIDQADDSGESSSLFESVDLGVTFILGKNLATTGSSVIYEARAVLGPVEEHLDGNDKRRFPFVVKYLLESTAGGRNSRSESDEVVKEYVISKFVATNLANSSVSSRHIKISPYPIFLSPAIPAPTVMNGKCAVRDICDGGKKGAYKIRFIVMERVGESMAMYSGRFLKGQLDPILLMKLMQQGADLFEALHGKGVIHNDVHPGNIVWADDPPNLDNAKFLLLDFGMSRFYPDDTNAAYWKDMKSVLAETESRLLSVHVIKGSRATRRDDVIRFIEVIAVLWWGNNYPKFESDKDEISFKSQAKFFTGIIGKSSAIDRAPYAVGPPHKNIIFETFDKLADRITRTGLDEPPNYDLIRKVAKWTETCVSEIKKDDKHICENPPL